MRTCPKCGKNYDEAPEKSRADGSEICRSCSEKEAVEAAVSAGAITTRQAAAILETLQGCQ